MSASRKESTHIRQSIEEPAYLPVGTEVSAKYRGAFCEANIKSVKKLVKCKVNFENGGGNSTVMDDAIIGNLRVGSDIKVKVQDGQDKAGTLVKITDSSTYTVIFDDGDERTLKRTSLCIKGEKHFNESETLDHLPLTDPENFGTPVMQQGKKQRKGRRSSLSLDENNDTDDSTVRRKLSVKDENSLEKVVLINFTEKKKTFQLPVLLLSSSEIRGDLKSPDNVLVRSFKDGKEMEVHFKDVKEFTKESATNSILTKGENPGLKSAVENALKYLETDQLPENWNDESLVEAQHKENGEHSSCSEAESDGDENDRNIFLEKLNKFLDEKGTPLQRVPVLAHRDLDLYKLYRIVLKMHGMEKVESWQSVYKKMNIPVVSSASAYHIRTAYERYLYDFEVHCREAEQIEKGKMRLKLPHEDENSKSVNSNHESETPVVSDSEKDNKNSKIISITKSPSKRGRYVRKAKPDRTQSLKSPSSPACAPRSPCSPRSVSSVSPSECTGSPSEPNVCDARELRAKTETIPIKNAQKVSGITDDSCETIANSCKKDRNSKLKSPVKNVEPGSQNMDADREYHEECGTEHSFDENTNEGCKDSKNLNRELNVKNDMKKCRDKEDPLDEGGGDGCHREDTKKVDVSFAKECSEEEDTVDVVNSPSGTSVTVDSDDRVERKKCKKKVEQKNVTKGDVVVDEMDNCFEYKVDDRIDVRYGRGRNTAVYHAKVTCVDPNAEEGLYYLVHYQGWNARHDEWIGDERIIGRDMAQIRTRTNKETTKNSKVNVKPTARATAKHSLRRNGKNSANHAVKGHGGRGRKRTPSPVTNTATNSRNGNSRGCKNKKDNGNEKIDAISEVKHASRITRRNSLTMTVETEKDALSERTPDTKMENASDKTSEDEIKLEEKQSNIKLLNSDESSGNLADCSSERNASSNLKRTRTTDKEKSSCDSPPVKKKPDDKDSSEEEVFEVEASENPKIQQASTTATDDTSGPDLTCSEQLPTTCSSPDPYVGGFPNTEGYLEDVIKDAKKCMGTKDKDSSSSLDEKKHEKPTTSRRGKCRRERKGRTLSSYSSFESTDLQNGTTTAPSVSVMLSPSWTPRYNFTEDLEELLKNEESSERIRLLTEKIKDIRKVYGELKSELANIDRKKKRRLKRKREEELSAEENTTRSSSSSPLATTNAVTSSNPPAAVECR